MYLNISNNELTNLIGTITELVGLEELRLSGNHLKVLPTGMGKLRKLRVLDLSDNNLYYLPREIGKLKMNLKFLYLKGNTFSWERQKQIKQMLPYTEIEFK